MMEKPSYVYILANAPHGTLYIGVTTDLVRRVWQHREQLKKWMRSWKIELIVENNPTWRDLYEDFTA